MMTKTMLDTIVSIRRSAFNQWRTYFVLWVSISANNFFRSSSVPTPSLKNALNSSHDNAPSSDTEKVEYHFVPNSKMTSHTFGDILTPASHMSHTVTKSKIHQP